MHNFLYTNGYDVVVSTQIPFPLRGITIYRVTGRNGYERVLLHESNEGLQGRVKQKLTFEYHALNSSDFGTVGTLEFPTTCTTAFISLFPNIPGKHQHLASIISRYEKITSVVNEIHH